MKIGIPKEIHDGEKRVATTPEVIGHLKKLGFDFKVPIIIIRYYGIEKNDII